MNDEQCKSQRKMKNCMMSRVSEWRSLLMYQKFKMAFSRLLLVPHIIVDTWKAFIPVVEFYELKCDCRNIFASAHSSHRVHLHYIGCWSPHKSASSQWRAEIRVWIHVCCRKLFLTQFLIALSHFLPSISMQHRYRKWADVDFSLWNCFGYGNEARWTRGEIIIARG